ncbi:TolC family protein [Petrachloros mirabilis]
MWYRCCVIACCLLLGIGQAGAATELVGDPTPAPSAPLPALALTLRGALAAVVGNNPDILLYKERIAAAEGQAQTHLGALLPNLSSTVRQTRQTQFLGTFGLSPVRTDPFSIFDARVTASQNVISVSLIQRWRASRQSLRSVESEAESRKFDVMASVALVYMERLKALEMEKMHDSNQQVMRELLGLVKQRQKAGVATGLDISRLEAQLAGERQLAASARYDAEHAKLNLLNLLSLPYETPVTFTDEFQAEVPSMGSAEAAVEKALVNRPEVQAQGTRIKATEFLYSSITGERLPSLVAQGDYGLIGNRWTSSLDTYSMALLLQIPIFDGAQREGRIAEARSQLRQEALRMRLVLNQVQMEVHDALAAVAAAKEQLMIAQQGMQSAAKEMSLAKERYRVITTASHFELTSALSAVARAREFLVDALFQLNASRIHLARATGSLESLN